MGPVIASIHEKRAQLRAEIMDEAELERRAAAGRQEASGMRGRLLGRDFLQRFADGGEGFVGLRAVGAAALGHVGPPAAALPAQRRHRGLDQVDGADLAWRGRR